MKRRFNQTVAFVQWVDASHQEGPCDIEQLDEGVTLESAGILVRENERVVSLALDACPDDGSWRHIVHIPRPYIKAIRRIKL